MHLSVYMIVMEPPVIMFMFIQDSGVPLFICSKEVFYLFICSEEVFIIKYQYDTAK